MCLNLCKWHEKIPKFTIFGKTVYKTGVIQCYGLVFRSEYYPAFRYFCDITERTKMDKGEQSWSEYPAIRRGFHSYQNVKDTEFLQSLYGSDVGQFRIPAFSMYYSARDKHLGYKLYVSNKLRFMKGVTL